ncbi:MAG: hypothetical protein KBA33_08095 [Cloacibacterium sp.]|nr:hypothetical protein [Cloacibacterium sp.]
MTIFSYKMTRLGWIVFISLLISLVNPLVFTITLALWFCYALFTFANKCYDSAVNGKD